MNAILYATDLYPFADLPLESGLAIERELQQKLFTSEDAREGLAAFTGKRTPEFRGR